MPHVIAALATLVLFVTAAAAPATAHAQPDPIVAIIEEEAAAYGVSAAWLLAVALCPGIEYYVWRPADWDELESVLRRE